MSARAEGGGGSPPGMVVDRIEGDFAVVELTGGPTLDLPLWMLPDGVREGDVIRTRLADLAGVRRIDLEIDRAETDRRRALAAESLSRLQSRDPGGDIVL